MGATEHAPQPNHKDHVKCFLFQASDANLLPAFCLQPLCTKGGACDTSCVCPTDTPSCDSGKCKVSSA